MIGKKRRRVILAEGVVFSELLRESIEAGDLLFPPLPGLRPAQDRVRAAVFSALGALVPDARVLDLFAGTGAYGIEALSRGAKSALFIEQNSRAAEALQQNLGSLDYSFPVLTSPVENWLPQAKDQYDLIFLDPPYDKTGAELSRWKVIQGLERLLAPSGRIIWEHHTSSVWSPQEPLREVWRRTYGRSTVTFLAASDAR